VLFIISQKKQDKKEALQTKEMLNTLDIDLKDASEDIDDTVAATASDTGEDTPPEPPVADLETPDTAKTQAETDAEEMERLARESDKAMLTRDEVVFGDDEFGIEDEESAGPDADLDTGDFEESPGMREIEFEEDGESPETGEPEPVRERAGGGETGGPESDDARAAATELFGDYEEDDMSELDALFEANTNVEDLVMSGKKLTEDDIVKDTSSEDFFSDEFEPEEPPPSPAAPVKDAVVREAAAREAARTTAEDVDVDLEAMEEAKTEPKPAAPAAMDPEDQKRHEKARRIARVIVNDIRNYNPENLAEGIRMGNIMKTLGKEVERGRLLYIKRVPQDITRETNYYREALIKILADGRPDLLGL